MALYHQTSGGPVEVKKVVRKSGGSTAEVNYVIKDGKLVWADPRIYLQSSGTQYIDTGIIPNSLYRYVFSYVATSSGNLMLFGQRTVGNYATSTEQVYYFVRPDTPEQIMFFGQTKKTVSECILGKKYSFSYEDNRSNTDSTRSIYLFALNKIGKPDGLYMGKMYEYRMYQGNVLKYDFVPVPTGLQIGNFTVPSNGMFDIVNQQFYPNAGTGTFTIGRDE